MPIVFSHLDTRKLCPRDGPAPVIVAEAECNVDPQSGPFRSLWGDRCTTLVPSGEEWRMNRRRKAAPDPVATKKKPAFH
ncbi:hypothetical protein E4A48_04865 [Xanthomonas cerealis pv. cerealis]|uniref:Uncharacterized protein n=1 Tax=Xanthomonas cerealis pv. cerealis TaxID=152263 RepID=A0A514EAP4_9XANT|nr:hypothetical protein E4A48_04865 [Xanthomonas translucens pv. cerealis]